MWGLDENYETQSGTQLNLEGLVEKRDSKHFFYLATIGFATLTAAIFALGIGSSESLGILITNIIFGQIEDATHNQ